MATSNFVDYVKVCCRSGAGGAGSSHLHRDKSTPKGGPDGGDGGRGGHIILEGNRNIWTLLALKYRKHVIAGAGQPGSGNHRSGASGNDIVLEVPLGTVARDAETGEVEFEITKHGEKKILTAGGVVVWATPTSNHRQIKRRVTRRRGKKDGKSGKFWS